MQRGTPKNWPLQVGPCVGRMLQVHACALPESLKLCLDATCCSQLRAVQAPTCQLRPVVWLGACKRESSSVAWLRLASTRFRLVKCKDLLLTTWTLNTLTHKHGRLQPKMMVTSLFHGFEGCRFVMEREALLPRLGLWQPACSWHLRLNCRDALSSTSG